MVVGEVPDRGEIAVVGIACRFPGAASSGEFWRLLWSKSSETLDSRPHAHSEAEPRHTAFARPEVG